MDVETIQCDLTGDWLTWRLGAVDTRLWMQGAASLIIRRHEAAVFLYPGLEGDMLIGPLETAIEIERLPGFLRTLEARKGRPPAAAVYFANLANPVSLRSGAPYINLIPRGGQTPVSVGVVTAMRVDLVEPRHFIRRIPALAKLYRGSDLQEHLKRRVFEHIRAELRSALASGIHPRSFVQAPEKLAARIEGPLRRELAGCGLALSDFAVAEVRDEPA